jgi:hypothetical protein
MMIRGDLRLENLSRANYQLLALDFLEKYRVSNIHVKSLRHLSRFGKVIVQGKHDFVDLTGGV